jgi:hypothetical protein
MVGWRGVKESVSMLQVVRDAVHGGCLKKGLPAQKKVGQRWRSESRGEFGIDVSGDLDRDDWLPDLHQDTALSQPSSLHSRPCSTFGQLRTSARFKELLGKPNTMLGRMHASDRTRSGSSLSLFPLSLR